MSQWSVTRYGCGYGFRATGASTPVVSGKCLPTNTSRLARPGWSTTQRCERYILRRLMTDRATVTSAARELGLSWTP